MRVEARYETGELALTIADNAGGIPDGTPRYLTRTPEDNFDAQIALNLKGVWLCLKYEIRAMLARGGGAIVNVASILGLRAAGDVAAYATSKAGLVHLTRVLALDKRRHDPHAPHRFGATAVYDLPLKNKLPLETPEVPGVFEALATLTAVPFPDADAADEEQLP